jgi:hypothetical protein
MRRRRPIDALFRRLWPHRAAAPRARPTPAAGIDRALAFSAGDRWPDARAMQQARQAVPREQIAAAPSVHATLQSFGAEPPKRSSGAGSFQTAATVAPISSDRPTRRRPDPSSLRRYGAIAAGVVAAAAVAAILVLRPGAPGGDAVPGAATPSSSVNVVVAPILPAPTVAPALPVAVEPSAEPSTSAAVEAAAPPTPSARPAASSGLHGRLPPPVKTAKPRDPLDKF